MNTKIFSLIYLWVLAFTALTDANAITVDDYANKYYEMLSVPRPSGGDVSNLDLMTPLYHEVPAAIQFDVLDRMLDKACAKRNSSVIYPILAYVGLMSNPTVPQRFEAHLYDLANDPNWGFRRDALDVMIRWNRPKDQDRILAALNDSVEDVREKAIQAVRGRTNAEMILKKYVQDHKADPAYKLSIMDAEAQLEALQKKDRGGR